jgi:hypothetical protein
MSVRRLGVLVRKLPPTSRLAIALHGQPWSLTDHLLADLWTLLAFVNSKKGSLPEDFDQPRRVELRAKAKAQQTEALRYEFLRRKRRYGHS